MAAYRKLNRFVPFASNTVCDFTGFLKKSTEVVRQWDGLYGIPEAVSIRQPQDFAPNIIPTMVFPNTRFEYPPAPEPERCPAIPITGNVLLSTENFFNQAWTGTAGVSGYYSNILNFPSVGLYLQQTYTAAIAASSIWTGVFVLSGYGTITIGISALDESESTEESVSLGPDPFLYQVNHNFLNAQSGITVYIKRDIADTAISVTVAINDCDADDDYQPIQVV
jgi:hypothetical protein